MQDWLANKMEINKRVRSILLEFGVDLQRVNVCIYPNRVLLRGALVRRQGESGEMDLLGVQQILADIQRIRKVHRVEVDLENWRRAPSGQLERKADESKDKRKADKG